jgi:hypothetical protein
VHHGRFLHILLQKQTIFSIFPIPVQCLIKPETGMLLLLHPFPTPVHRFPCFLKPFTAGYFVHISFRTKPINKPLLHRCLLFYTTSLSASLPVSSNRPPPLKTKNLYLYFKSDKSTNHPLSDFHAQQKSRAEFLSSRLSDDMHISKSNHLPLAQESPTNRFLPLPKLLDRIDEIVV